MNDKHVPKSAILGTHSNKHVPKNTILGTY